MSRSEVANNWPALSPRHTKDRLRSDWVEIGLLPLRLVSVSLLISIGWVHLNLWRVGYRYLPTIGPLFLVAAVSAPVLAFGMLVRPSRLIGLLGIGLVTGILAGLIVSVNVGLFGFYESLSAPSAMESIVLEIAAAVTLASWVALDVMKASRPMEQATNRRARIAASRNERTVPTRSSPRIHKATRSRHRCADHR